MMNRRELLGSAGAITLLPACDVLAGAGSRGALAFDAALNIGPAHSGAGNHRWAQIVGGGVVGDVLTGTVLSGRLDWHVCPASGALQVELRCRVRCTDGQERELHDCSAHGDEAGHADLPGLSTAPRVLGEAAAASIAAPLAGRLDPAGFARGVVRLRAFPRP